MDALIRELTADINEQQDSDQHCNHHQQIAYDIPVVYTSSGKQPPKVKSFLDEQDHVEDVRSKLLKYNPSLSQYLNNTVTTSYSPVLQSYGYLNINNQYSHSEIPQPGNLSLHSQQVLSVQSDSQKHQILHSQNNYSQNQFDVISEHPQISHNKQSKFTQERVENYVSNIKDTREMADTKFKKYFGKPCFANYGGMNTKMENGGIIYGQYMKTHNVSPHKNGNHPKVYETYQSALLHANRTILNQNKDEQDIIKQIDRKQKIEKQINDRKNGITQAKSRQVVQRTYNSQRNNKSMTKHNFTQNFISKEEVKQKDKHIEQKQHQNYIDKVKYNYPDHHLIPIQKAAPLTQSSKQIVGKKVVSSSVKSPKVKPPSNTRQPHHEQSRNYQIIQLSHAQTQTAQPTLQRVSSNPKLSKVKSEQSVSQNKVIKNTSHQQIQSYSIKIKQPEPLLVTKPPPLSKDQPKQLSVKDAYSFQEESMPPSYEYCLCKHKQCQHKVRVKQQAYSKGINNSQIRQRLVSCAKQASMYSNYLPDMSLNSTHQEKDTVLENKQIKQYYDLPRERMNPQNYACQQVEELKQIPYAGKPLRYNFNRA